MADNELKQLKTKESRLAFSEKLDSFIGAEIGATAAVAAPKDFSIWALMVVAAIVCLLIFHFGKNELGQVRRRIQELESQDPKQN